MSEEFITLITLNESSQKKHTTRNDMMNTFNSNELPFIKEKQKHLKCHKKHKNTAEDIPGEGNSSHFPWRFIATVLGVICFLLMAAAITVAIFTANSSPKRLSAIIQQKGPHYQPCPKNWVWFRCSCYYFSKEELTWRESQHTCSSLDSSLLKINREEMNFFSLKTFFWIGIYNNNTGKQWLWENDLALPSDIVSFFELQKKQGCLSYKSRGTYLIEKCETKQPYICKNHHIYPMKSQET
ncbi:killer cell lectin-like receptor subfamily E member 1 [Castor canadensis]|uniref:Killer cell lectin-like receptor subfamily E member 1 n=2 Tax=Castor canadensis TaxID=51338 RepID=A0AC58MRY2_CASCN